MYFRSQVLPDEQSSLVEFNPAILKTSKKTKELSKALKGQMIIVSIFLYAVFQ